MYVVLLSLSLYDNHRPHHTTLLSPHHTTTTTTIGFFFAAPLEVTVIYILMIFELNAYSATAAVACTVVFVPIQLYLAKVYSRVRTRTAGHTGTQFIVKWMNAISI